MSVANSKYEFRLAQRRQGAKIRVLKIKGRKFHTSIQQRLETKGKRRLDDISFAIEPGQFVALVGGSGAGKSTLMRTLLGTEQTTQGVVYLNGEDLRKNFNIYRMQIGYVPKMTLFTGN